jgi:hypothetical protein
MKAQNRKRNLRRQYERLLSACDLYKWAAERRVARSQLRERTIRDIESIRAELDRILGLVRELPKLPPEEPLERALYGPLREIRSVLWPLNERIEGLPEFAAEDPEEEVQQDRDAGSEAPNTET